MIHTQFYDGEKLIGNFHLRRVISGALRNSEALDLIVKRELMEASISLAKSSSALWLDKAHEDLEEKITNDLKLLFPEYELKIYLKNGAAEVAGVRNLKEKREPINLTLSNGQPTRRIYSELIKLQSGDWTYFMQAGFIYKEEAVLLPPPIDEEVLRGYFKDAGIPMNIRRYAFDDLMPYSEDSDC
jgi:hypothetical protein